MDETVENRVGEGRVTNGIMPLVDGKLAGHDGGAHGVAVLDELACHTYPSGVGGYAALDRESTARIRRAAESADH